LTRKKVKKYNVPLVKTLQKVKKAKVKTRWDRLNQGDTNKKIVPVEFAKI